MSEQVVSVCAWSHDDGAGFDWYTEAAQADSAFEAEKGNCDEFYDTNWTAYRFDFVIPFGASKNEITRLIDEDIDGLCERAKIKYKSKRVFLPFRTNPIGFAVAS